MTVNPIHWLDVARKEVLPGGLPMLTRRALVIHYTEGATAQSSIDFWRSPDAKGACAHIVIDRDGTIYQCRPFNRTCGHAGISRWKHPTTDRFYRQLNSCAIGIELANAGNVVSVSRRFSTLPMIDAPHRNDPKRVDHWEQFPVAQLVALTYLARCLVDRYKLDDITGHDCIAPERKLDPGPAFPMQQLREACGFQGLPAVHWP